MAPVLTDKATNNLEVDPKRTNGADDESDEGFVSPSVQRIMGQKKRKDSSSRSTSSSSNNSSSSASDNDSTHTDSTSSSSSPPSGASSQNVRNSDDDEVKVNGTPGAVNRKRTTETPAEGSSTNNNNSVPATASAGATAEATTSAAGVSRESVEKKAESLARYIVYTLIGKSKNGCVESNDCVERTLLRCVKMMQQKHEILFKGMMKRLRVTPETGYVSFVTVANTLFEDEKMVVTWSRIVALYAFGGQLALYCKDNNMEDLACKVADFMGKYAKEVLTPYVTSIGGWNKICEEFPEESDIENKIRRVLSWTAVGLGVAATVSYLTSR